MKCGSCKSDHDTVAEVRSCYGVVQVNGVDEDLYQTASNARALFPMTEKQYNYVQSLRIERGEPPMIEGYEQAAEVMTLDWAKAEIARLKLKPKTAKTKEIDKKISDIPEGRFAVNSLSGKNDLDFYKVEKPEEGQWAGYTFVKMIVGGKPEFSVKGARRHDVLKAIADAGWEVAAQTYARETGTCWKCGIDLTKFASRQLGIGRTCAGKVGLGNEWDRIQYKWESEQRKNPDLEPIKIPIIVSDDPDVTVSGVSVPGAVQEYLVSNDTEQATWS